jgi:pimeloyl-ACP methyl ester carboxylesterase
MPLAEALADDFGVSSVLFDFSGHGQSTGALTESSLAKRVSEAHAAIKAVQFEDNFSICAFSMGAHVALELIPEYTIRSLILFYPAVYPTGAYCLPFGPTFSAEIRRPDEWRQSLVFDHLGTFGGGLFVLIGDRDEVIPPDLPPMLISTARNARRKDIAYIPGGSHNLLPDICARKPLFADVCSRIAAYTSDTVVSRRR